MILNHTEVVYKYVCGQIFYLKQLLTIEVISVIKYKKTNAIHFLYCKYPILADHRRPLPIRVVYIIEQGQIPIYQW